MKKNILFFGCFFALTFSVFGINTFSYYQSQNSNYTETNAVSTPTDRRIWIKTSDNWRELSASTWIHYWGGSSSTTWPGNKLSPYSENSIWYYQDVPYNTSSFACYRSPSNKNPSQEEWNRTLDRSVSNGNVLDIIKYGGKPNTGEEYDSGWTTQSTTSFYSGTSTKDTVRIWIECQINWMFNDGCYVGLAYETDNGTKGNTTFSTFKDSNNLEGYISKDDRGWLFFDVPVNIQDFYFYRAASALTYDTIGNAYNSSSKVTFSSSNATQICFMYFENNQICSSWNAPNHNIKKHTFNAFMEGVCVYSLKANGIANVDGITTNWYNKIDSTDSTENFLLYHYDVPDESSTDKTAMYNPFDKYNNMIELVDDNFQSHSSTSYALEGGYAINSSGDQSATGIFRGSASDTYSASGKRMNGNTCLMLGYNNISSVTPGGAGCWCSAYFYNQGMRINQTVSLTVEFDIKKCDSFTDYGLYIGISGSGGREAGEVSITSANEYNSLSASTKLIGWKHFSKTFGETHALNSNFDQLYFSKALGATAKTNYDLNCYYIDNVKLYVVGTTTNLLTGSDGRDRGTFEYLNGGLLTSEKSSGNYKYGGKEASYNVGLITTLSSNKVMELSDYTGDKYISAFYGKIRTAELLSNSYYYVFEFDLYIDGIVNNSYDKPLKISLYNSSNSNTYYSTTIADTNSDYSLLADSEIISGWKHVSVAFYSTQDRHVTTNSSSTTKTFDSYLITFGKPTNSGYYSYIYIDNLKINACKYVCDATTFGAKMMGEDTLYPSPRECSVKYADAKTWFNTLSSSEKDAFQNNSDYQTQRARDRYTAWCRANGDGSPYGTAIVYNLPFLLLGNNLDYSSSTIVIVITSLVAILSLTTLSILVIYKKKKTQ